LNRIFVLAKKNLLNKKKYNKKEAINLEYKLLLLYTNPPLKI